MDGVLYTSVIYFICCVYYIPDCGTHAARSMAERRGAVPSVDGNRCTGGSSLLRAADSLEKGNNNRRIDK